MKWIGLIMFSLCLFGVSGCAQSGRSPDWENLSLKVAEDIPALRINDEHGFSVTGSLHVRQGSGDVYIVGIGEDRFVRSRDGGDTWEKVDDVLLKGRTYGGFSVNFDPQTGGMIVFEIRKKGVREPQGAMTTDGGESWRVIRKPDVEKHDGFSWGMANWADEEVNVIVAKRHHGPPEQWLSTDAGQSWRKLDFLCRNPGVIDARTFVAGIDDSVKDVENGIYLSEDQGESYRKVSDYVVTGKFPVRWDGDFYWVVADGLIVSRDWGRTWRHTGGKLRGGLWGPYFGRNGKEMMVVGSGGFYVTKDGGAHWRKVQDFTVPGDQTDVVEKNYNVMHPCASFGWNPAHDLLYASRIFWTAERLQLPDGTLSE